MKTGQKGRFLNAAYSAEEFRNIVYKNKNHQKNQCAEAHQCNDCLEFPGHLSPYHQFHQKENKPSAVECRQRQQIHNGKVYG